MELLLDTPDPALATARRLLHAAHANAVLLRRRVDLLADATDWRSRATDAYRAGIASLADDIDLLARRITACDGEVAEAQRAPAGASSPRWP